LVDTGDLKSPGSNTPVPVRVRSPAVQEKPSFLDGFSCIWLKGGLELVQALGMPSAGRKAAEPPEVSPVSGIPIKRPHGGLFYWKEGESPDSNKA
jgi:hypothetical protein